MPVVSSRLQNKDVFHNKTIYLLFAALTGNSFTTRFLLNGPLIHVLFSISTFDTSVSVIIAITVAWIGVRVSKLCFTPLHSQIIKLNSSFHKHRKHWLCPILEIEAQFSSCRMNVHGYFRGIMKFKNSNQSSFCTKFLAKLKTKWLMFLDVNES